MKMREGELEFDFTAAKIVQKLDDPARQRPQGMQLVDFVLEEAHRLIMIEVKDLSCKAKGCNPAANEAIEKSRTEFAKKVQEGTLIADELTPKARDSYTYIHLMERDNKPILYAFLLAADKLSLDPALLLGFKDRLLSRLRQEADQPWNRHYVTDCVVLNEQTWNTTFQQYPVVRV